MLGVVMLTVVKALLQTELGKVKCTFRGLIDELKQFYFVC
jgi:hypothetical protein